MDKVQINVKDYYGNAQYYSVMPEPVFNLLEAAFLNDLDTIMVERDVYEKMESDYQKKIAR